MKRFTVSILIAVLAGIPLWAQTWTLDKGSKSIGGSASFSSSSGDLYENWDGKGSTELSFMPSAAYFIAPGVAVGGDLVFSKFSQGDESRTTIGIGPSIAYFFGANVKPKVINGKIYPFAAGSFLYKSTKHKSEQAMGKSAAANNEYTVKFTTINLGGGILYLLNAYVGITAQITYAMDGYKPEESDAIKGNRILFEAGVSAFVH